MSYGKKHLLELETDWLKCDARVLRVGLDPYEIAIYCYLASVPENFHPSEENIAKYLEISPMKVTKSLRRLVSVGVLEKGKQFIGKGRKQRNIYHFIPYERWLIKAKPIVEADSFETIWDHEKK